MANILAKVLAYNPISGAEREDFTLFFKIIFSIIFRALQVFPRVSKMHRGQIWLSTLTFQ
jgi:hypothetical protein